MSCHVVHAQLVQSGNTGAPDMQYGVKHAQNGKYSVLYLVQSGHWNVEVTREVPNVTKLFISTHVFMADACYRPFIFESTINRESGGAVILVMDHLQAVQDEMCRREYICDGLSSSHAIGLEGLPSTKSKN
jgi:hypothetical protein